MGTTTRPELSEKNKYWIEKHRYYELKHFCLQYLIWKKAYLALDGLSKRPTDLAVMSKTNISDPTGKCAESRIFYADRMNMLERVANGKSFVGGLKYYRIVILLLVDIMKLKGYVLYISF